MMSKDIRSFLISKKAPNTDNLPTTDNGLKKQKKLILSDDDDFIPESPAAVKDVKKNKIAGKRRILDDSDEDTSPKKSKFKETKSKIDCSEKKKPSNVKNTSDSLKEVKITDIFSSVPIKRTQNNHNNKVGNSVENNKHVANTHKAAKQNIPKSELEVHSDIDFQKTLIQIDDSETKHDPSVKLLTEKISMSSTSKNDMNCSPNIKTSEANRNSNTISPKSKPSHKASKTEFSKHSPVKIVDKLNKIKSPNDKIETKEFSKQSLKIASHNANKTEPSKHSPVKTVDKLNNGKSPSKEKRQAKPLSEQSIKVNNRSFGLSAATKLEMAKRKRDYSEFLEDQERPVPNIPVEISVAPSELENECEKDIVNSHNAPQQRYKRQKVDNNDTLNESGLTDEERFERKKHSAILYQKYLNRSGPKHHGAKEIPEGNKDCFSGLVFVITGELDSIKRDEATEIIKKYGGKVNSGVTGKVTHILYGEEAGPAKLSKAEKLNIPLLTEDDFIQLIKIKSDLKSNTPTVISEKVKPLNDTFDKNKIKKQKLSPKQEKINSINVKEKTVSPRKSTFNSLRKSSSKTDVISIKTNKSELENAQQNNDIATPSISIDSKHFNGTGDDIIPKTDTISFVPKPVEDRSNLAWVDKYKPQTLKQIIGQHGEASNVKKLTTWLTKWYYSRKMKLPKPNPWAKSDDGGFYKAALLSGPPGVGKTTSVSLVCKELGFDIVEFNASDTRNKTLIKEQISELLTTNSLAGYAQGKTGKSAVTKKHVLVMDEVDGMAGNEDRGGLQELIGLIKYTSVPIICTCNDRDSPKMRSLVNYCYDLRFQRPRVEQIKSAVMTICFKEGVKITPDAVVQLIICANQDIRQTLHLLSMWSAADKNISTESVNKDSKTSRKDKKLGAWDVLRKVFSAEDHKTMSIYDKSDLFFHDYSMSPLFVQENYLIASPHCPKREMLRRFAQAADSISSGDLVDAAIRGNSAWTLLPIQAMYSSVIPGSMLSGHLTGQIQFPSWLGKNSRRNKLHRLAQEVHAHTRLSTSGSKQAIFLDYAPHLRDAIVVPLVCNKIDGISQSLKAMQSYNLLREDLDSLTELSLWPGQRDPMVMVESKVKAAMTRTYNKEATPLPYAPPGIKKTKSTVSTDSTEMLEHEEEDAIEENEDSDPENDALIKKPKMKSASKRGGTETAMTQRGLKNKSKDGYGKSSSKK